MEGIGHSVKVFAVGIGVNTRSLERLDNHKRINKLAFPMNMFEYEIVPTIDLYFH